jgi:hypothetical protein
MDDGENLKKLNYNLSIIISLLKFIFGHIQVTSKYLETVLDKI